MPSSRGWVLSKVNLKPKVFAEVNHLRKYPQGNQKRYRGGRRGTQIRVGFQVKSQTQSNRLGSSKGLNFRVCTTSEQSKGDELWVLTYGSCWLWASYRSCVKLSCSLSSQNWRQGSSTQWKLSECCRCCKPLAAEHTEMGMSM